MNRDSHTKIAGRYFLVGSARSGTTLLQAMLAAHTTVHSFPETHFFCELPLRGRRFRWGRLLRRDAARSTFSKFLSIIGREDLASEVPGRSPLFRHFAAAYRRSLDADTLDHGKTVWVEKTPHHIDFIPEISMTMKDARFIHIVRDGRDVIASQLDAAGKSPEYWGARSLDEIIGLWNSDIEVSASYAGDARHLIVSYEDLIDSPEHVLQGVCQFMGVEFEVGMLDYHSDVTSVLGWRDKHEYMSNVHQPVNDTRLIKFKSILTTEQQEYVTEHLTDHGDAKIATGLVRRSETELAIASQGNAR